MGLVSYALLGSDSQGLIRGRRRKECGRKLERKQNIVYRTKVMHPA